MNDDPFAFDEDNRTVMQPRGQGRARDTTHRAAPGASRRRRDQGNLPRLGGINRLEKAASRLLPLLITIKHTPSHPDPTALRNDLIRELEEFKRLARQVLDDPRQVTQASYVLCTALDEAVMNTPWGHAADWSQNSLLATFHNEVVGGERFFSLLKGLGKRPADNIELLELMYVCLALGYEGSYRIARNGQDTLVKVRRWLHGLIDSVRGRPPSQLSLHWRGSEVAERRLPRSTPVWVTAAAALALASLVFLALRISLVRQAEASIERFWRLDAQPVAVRTVAPPVRPREDITSEAPVSRTLSDLLAAEITARRLAVVENFDSARVRIVGDTLFDSGRASVDPGNLPLLARIAEALNAFEGAVLVTGHSDNIPIRAGRYASNLDLSRARAASVQQALATGLERPGRIEAEGRGSLEPVADNATAAGRAQNRRVEITLFY